jgi:hypothetical protein
MITIDPTALRDAFARGVTYSVLVPSSTQQGVLEDVVADLADLGVHTAGYDIHADPLGCVIELRESGECMVSKDLEHIDLRLLQVGEAIDHHVDEDEEALVEVQSVAIAKFGAAGAGGAEDVFSWVEAFLPKRYTNEEFGDAEEEIREKLARGCSAWWVRVKIVTTIFWVLAHIAVEEYARFRKHMRG